MNKIIFTVMIATFGLGGVCYAANGRLSDDNAIREAAYRYMFQHNASSLRQNAAVYFLAIRGEGNKLGDPSQELMGRFAGNKPPVKKWSESQLSPEMGVVDKASGERGLIFETGQIKWLSRTQAEITGGYYEGNMSASKSTFTVVKQSGKWVVVKEKREGIS